jgi:hypothetical protein
MKWLVLAALVAVSPGASCEAQDFPTPSAPSVADTGTSAAAVNWQQLYEKAESAAQQWEAQDKKLEVQLVTQLKEMDSANRATSKKEQAEPLPPAPTKSSSNSHSTAPPDYKSLFGQADSRGKAWRARALVLDDRVRTFQERISGQKIKAAGYSPPGLPARSITKVPHSPRVAHAVPVSAYTRRNGMSVVPSYQSTPPR